MNTTIIKGFGEVNKGGIDVYDTKHVRVTIVYGEFSNSQFIVFKTDNFIKIVRSIEKIVKGDDFDLKDERDMLLAANSHCFGI